MVVAAYVFSVELGLAGKMWVIIKASENYKHACENLWPLEGCGEGYNEQI